MTGVLSRAAQNIRAGRTIDADECRALKVPTRNRLAASNT
jgi:hypothetical protein